MAFSEVTAMVLKFVEKYLKNETAKKIGKEVAKQIGEKTVDAALGDDPDYQDFKKISDTAKGVDNISKAIKELSGKPESNEGKNTDDSEKDAENKKSEGDEGSRNSDNPEPNQQEKKDTENKNPEGDKKSQNADNPESKQNDAVEKQREKTDMPSPDENKLEKSSEEKIAQQNQEIKSVESGEKKLDSTQEKGNYGEMKMDQDMREKGYERISSDMVTSIDSPGHQGIDGVYYNPDGVPKYIIADAKYGTAQLSETQDGKQMSDNWIDKRLDESVGKEVADDIRMEKLINPDNVGTYVARVDSDGKVSYDKLDSSANVVEKDVKINE